VSGSGISWAICKSALRPRQITMPAPHHSVFYRLDAIPTTQPTVLKHWRQALIGWGKCGIVTSARWQVPLWVPCGMWVPIAVRLVANCYTPCIYLQWIAAWDELAGASLHKVCALSARMTLSYCWSVCQMKVYRRLTSFSTLLHSTTKPVKVLCRIDDLLCWLDSHCLCWVVVAWLSGNRVSNVSKIVLHWMHWWQDRQT